MNNLIEEETQPWTTVFLFGGYCFTGVSMLSYFAFRGFKNAEAKVKVLREPGQRLALAKMKSFGGLYKAVYLLVFRCWQLGYILVVSFILRGTSI